MRSSLKGHLICCEAEKLERPDTALTSFREACDVYDAKGASGLAVAQARMVLLTTGLPHGLQGPMDEQSRGWNLNEITYNIKYIKVYTMDSAFHESCRHIQSWGRC